MKLVSLKNDSAWQPLTFKGVAAFASAPLRRLLLIQFLFALLTAGVVVWCLDQAWFPTIRRAILQMPETGEIRSGQLSWTNETPRLLAEGPFLSVIADPNHTGEVRVPSYFQIEFGRSTVRVLSLLGYRDWLYPGKPWIVKFNRTELEPWWGAWRPPLLWMVFGGVLIGLMAIWQLLALFYFFSSVDFRLFCESRFESDWKLEAIRRGINAGCAGNDSESGGVRSGRIGFGSADGGTTRALARRLDLLRRRNLQTSGLAIWRGNEESI